MAVILHSKETHIDDIPPSTPIWRYMDFARFVSVLANGTLRFTKAATFRDDPFEGFCRAFSIEHSPDVGGNGDIQDSKESDVISQGKMLARLSEIAAVACNNARDYLYVNSWCAGSESMAMWEIYGARGTGIALESSIGQYRGSVRFDVDPSHYDFGTVSYHQNIIDAEEIIRDFRNSAIPLPGPALRRKILRLAFHKRECYSYEREWRATLYQDLRPETGIDVDFELSTLISAVHVGPRSEQHFVELVESVMKKYELHKPLKRSALLASPGKQTIGASHSL